MTAPDLSTAITEVLEGHGAWGMTGPDTHGAWEVECYDCGALLGDYDALTADSKAEGATNFEPEFDHAVLVHQTAMLAAMLAPVIREREAAALREAVSDFESRVGVSEFSDESTRDETRWGHVEEAWEHQGPYMDWLRNRADQLEES